MPRVTIDGVEYVPKGEVPVATDRATAEACRALCAWIYLRDKPGNAIWEALSHLSPDLNVMAGQDAAAAYAAARVACGLEDND
jgi:hypothetical protein